MLSTVTYDPATESFSHFGGGQWRQTYPLARLLERLAFYRRMKLEHPKAGDRYDGDIAALAGLARELGLEQAAAA